MIGVGSISAGVHHGDHGQSYALLELDGVQVIAYRALDSTGTPTGHLVVEIDQDPAGPPVHVYSNWATARPA